MFQSKSRTLLEINEINYLMLGLKSLLQFNLVNTFKKPREIYFIKPQNKWLCAMDTNTIYVEYRLYYVRYSNLQGIIIFKLVIFYDVTCHKIYFSLSFIR